MTSENFVQPAIPRFDGHYDHWSMLMENLLRSKEFWQRFNEKKYHGSSRIKRAQLQALRRDFEVLQMKDGESVTDYCSRTMCIAICDFMVKK
uniref:Retrovirus-related Pol polyprotein from transposon TNT 1-94 n=1 Tax=Cajanus cajan TaxID=3821 RepID=A0A151SSB2_CAJCA|nr:hypothetical protein KK1_003973 [Cajanus cajan]KYP57707.1 hypothetical protein KK1_003977 [Cajanus cajan]